MPQPNKPTKKQLYLVPTPIGNLEDITLRALRILKEVDLILAEDTRQIGKICSHHQIAQAKFFVYHDHNKEKLLPEILELLEFSSIALVSDAGTPLISDPGYKLVEACLEHNITVIPLPGPTSIITALSASGLPTDQFSFLGFIPRTSNKKQKIFADWKDYAGTLIFFESPHRIVFTIEDMQVAFENKGIVVLARELTKLHEEFIRGSFDEVLQYFANKKPKGEFVVLWHGRD